MFYGLARFFKPSLPLADDPMCLKSCFKKAVYAENFQKSYAAECCKEVSMSERTKRKKV